METYTVGIALLAALGVLAIAYVFSRNRSKKDGGGFSDVFNRDKER
jgi:hypothetical protein